MAFWSYGRKTLRGRIPPLGPDRVNLFVCLHARVFLCVSEPNLDPLMQHTNNRYYLLILRLLGIPSNIAILSKAVNY